MPVDDGTRLYRKKDTYKQEIVKRITKKKKEKNRQDQGIAPNRVGFRLTLFCRTSKEFRRLRLGNDERHILSFAKLNKNQREKRR